MLSDFPDLLSRWTAKDLADDLAVPYPTAAAMKQRGTVAVCHWERLIRAAEGKSLVITAEMLARFAAQRKTRSEAAD